MDIRRRSTVPIAEYLAVVDAVIDMHGWTSRYEAKANGTQSTAEIARDMLSEGFEPPEKSKRATVDALAWLNGDDVQENEQILELRSMVMRRRVLPYMLPTVATVIFLYRTADERKERRAQAIALTIERSDYVGKVGEQWNGRMTIAHFREYGDRFRKSILYTGYTPEGSQIVFYSSNLALEKGVEYEIEGRVKVHQPYNGVKQSVLNYVRCNGRRA